MKDNELYRTLQTLQDLEIREFRLFMASAFHNQDPVLKEYFDLLLNKKGNLLKALPDDDWFIQYAKISKIKTKKDLYNLRNKILVLLEQYFLVRHALKSSFDKNLALAGIYRSRNLRVRYERVMRGMSRQAGSEKIKNGEFLLRQYLWQKFEFEDPDQVIRRIDDRKIEQVTLALDEYYLTEKMMLSSEMTNRSHLLQTRYDEFIPADSLPLLERESHPDILNLYLSVYKLFQNPDNNEAYLHYDRQLIRFQSSLTKRELGSLYLYAINFCIQCLNLGRNEYLKHMNDLIGRMENQNILLQGGAINPWVFKNAIQMFLRLNKPDSARKFLESHTPHLPDSHRESVSVLAQAQVAFALKNYEEIFYLTSQLKYLDIHLVVGLKLLACKAHLQLDNRIRLEGELEAFSKYLRYHEKELGKDRTNRIDRFINICRRINHLQPLDNKGLTTIFNLVRQDKRIPESVWLQEFLEQQLQRTTRRTSPKKSGHR